MLEKLKEIIAEKLGVEVEEIKEDSRFKEDLKADSLDLFELVMAIEEEFGNSIPSEDLEKLVTVGDVIGYMKEQGIEE
jgi:acyl carrier protein